MSNILIPKEKLTAYERWELASFDPLPADHQDAIAALAALEEIRQKARDEGYAQGHETGHEEGHEAGHTEGYNEGYEAGIKQARLDALQMHTLLQNIEEALNQIDEQLAQSLLDLALQIARKMTGAAFQVNPDIILKIVNDAINSLPHFNQNAHLLLHPDDAELVKKQMGEHLSHAGWKIFPDTRITRGGCKVETAHSHIDATTEMRWQRIVEAIGQDKSWMK